MTAAFVQVVFDGSTTGSGAVQTLTIPSGVTTTPGNVIGHMACVGAVYETIMATLAGLTGVQMTPCPYDWRLDITKAADTLAGVLTQLPATDEIVIVAHSQGGLVTRYLIESGKYSGNAWFARLKTAVLIAIPHLGAPLALFRVLGLDALDPIILPAWAMKKLGSDPTDYPSPYQLVPGALATCVNLPDLSNTDVVSAFNKLLDPIGIAASTALHDAIDPFTVPAGIDYHLFYGYGLSTISRVSVAADGTPVRVFDDGDGTVPVWSSNPQGYDPKAVGKVSSLAKFQNDHLGLMNDPNLLATLQTLLGTATAPIAGTQLASAGRVTVVGQPIDLLIAVAGGGPDIQGNILCRPILSTTATSFPVQGAQGASQLNLPFEMPNTPGTYVVSFDGTPNAITPPLRVTVMDADALDASGLAALS